MLLLERGWAGWRLGGFGLVVKGMGVGGWGMGRKEFEGWSGSSGILHGGIKGTLRTR